MPLFVGQLSHAAKVTVRGSRYPGGYGLARCGWRSMRILRQSRFGY